MLVAKYPTSQSAKSSPETLLDQGFGHGILVSLSIAFGLVIIVAVWIQERYLSEESDRSEMYVKSLRFSILYSKPSFQRANTDTQILI